MRRFAVGKRRGRQKQAELRLERAEAHEMAALDPFGESDEGVARPRMALGAARATLHRRMRLIGQYDSPFVRRTAIAMRLYGLAFEHLPWSVFRDADRIATYNPLRRVPTLILDDDTVLVESSAILEVLDERHAVAHGAEAASLLLPRRGPLRRKGLAACGFATGVGDKAVSLVYEPLLREKPSHTWIQRCRTQILETLQRLETERAAMTSPFWLGERISHADIAIACVWRFTNEAHPGLVPRQTMPSLEALCQRCESLPAFQEIVQPLQITFR